MTPRWAITSALVVLAAAGAAPPAAQAQSCSAKPVERSITDPAGDSDVAPDIVGVRFSIARDCTVSVGVLLGDREPIPAALGEREWVSIVLDVDGNTDTGSLGADIALVQSAPNERHLGVWNGEAYRFSEAPGEPYHWGGVTAPAASLNIKASATIAIRAVAYTDGGVADGAPDRTMLHVPVQIDETVPDPVAPSPPASTVAPAPPALTPTAPAPAAAPPVAKTPRQCRVPAVRGMSVKRATARMKKAGCRFRTRRVASRRVRPGRVLSTSPRAKRLTREIVELRVARRPAGHR